jgi:two-component system cell cycle response regulator
MNTPPVPRVLVVDDVLQVRQVFARFLTMAGMAPSFAADGVEGLAAARVSPPDLVLCDLEMPPMDGVALCAALRADAATRRVPIVAVTGGGGDAALAAVAAGCDAVLPKPCSAALLIATVRDLLGSVEKARAVGAATTPLPPPVSTR